MTLVFLLRFLFWLRRITEKMYIPRTITAKMNITRKTTDVNTTFMPCRIHLNGFTFMSSAATRFTVAISCSAYIMRALPMTSPFFTGAFTAVGVSSGITSSITLVESVPVGTSAVTSFSGMSLT